MSVTLAFWLLAAAAVSDGPALHGVVTAEDGRPLSNALVFIYTAKPKTGTSATCPSCYLDCRKKGTTNARGEFEIPSLDPTLRFRVGAVAEDHESAFLTDVDPAAGPVKFTLASRASLPDDPRRVVRGRVVDQRGAVVVGAKIELFGIEDRKDTGFNKRFGAIGVPPTITDARGSFALALPRAADAVFVSVEARDLARANLSTPTGVEERTLTLARGATVRGRILKDGKPIQGVIVGLVQADRNAEHFVGEFTASTDASGRFLLMNVVPGEKMVVYGKVLGLGSHGAIPARQIATGADGNVLDLGDIAVVPAVTLSGRVTLSDGKALPAQTRVSVQRSEAWDSVEQEASAEGAFRFEGLPRESVEIAVVVPGYGFSPKNASYLANPWVGQGSIAGRLDANVHLSLLLEPVADLPQPKAPRSPEEWQAFTKSQEETHSRPLRGIP